MALIDDILNTPTSVPTMAAPEPNYPPSPDQDGGGNWNPVVENAPQSKKPGFFKQMLSNALQGIYDANQYQMGNPDERRARLATDQGNLDVNRQNAQSLELQRQMQNELVPVPKPIADELQLQNPTVRRADWDNVINAWLNIRQRQSQSELNARLQEFLERGRNDRFAAGEEGKNARFAKGEQGKDARAANSPRNQGVFIPLTDNQGNLTGQFYNNRTTAIVNNPNAAGARKTGLPSQENADRASFGTLQTQFSKLGDLVNKYPDRIGPVAGRVGKLKTEYLGGDQPAADLYQTVTDMQNQLIYLASGKQINEQEFNRLKQAMPHPDLPIDTFKVRMKNFEARMDEIFKRRTGQMGGNSGSGNNGGTVRIQLPDGRTGTIPKSSLQKYVGAGAKVIN